MDVFSLAFPLARQHLGMPMGNGSLGVLVWGGERNLSLTIALAGCWDRRSAERLRRPVPYGELVAAWTPESVEGIQTRLARAGLPENATPRAWKCRARVPGGTFTLALCADVRRVTLRYIDGTVEVETDGGALHLELSMRRDRLRIRDPRKLVRAVRASPAWDRIGAELADIGFAPPARWDGGWFQPCPDDPADAGTWADLRPARDGWRLRAELRRAGEAAPPAAADDAEDDDEDWPDARRWWRRYWRDLVEIRLPDERYNTFFKLAAYKFAAATVPGRVPCTLQGPWQEDYQTARWNNDYHFNVNVQQIYSLALPLGRAEHMTPLFDLLDSPVFRGTLRENARLLCGVDDGLLLTHAVNDRGEQVGGLVTEAYLDFVCGGWTALLYYARYVHTDDREFLRERAWPFMRGVMNAFLATLRETPDGDLTLPVAASAEYGCCFPILVDGRACRQNTGRDPSNALSCFHALADALQRSAAELGLPPDPRWADLRRRLPRFSRVHGRAAVWAGQDLDVCHRHHSHLSMIFPFMQIHELDADETEAVDRAVDRWIEMGQGKWSEWCYPWAMRILTLWGMRDAPAALLETWSRLFWNESMATVYRPRFRGLSAHRRADLDKPPAESEVMQLDGTMAGAAALIGLLVQEKGDTIELFPAVPEHWPEAEFKRVRLTGGLIVSAAMRGEHLTRLEIRAPGPRRRTLVFGHGPARRRIEVTLEAGIPHTDLFPFSNAAPMPAREQHPCLVSDTPCAT